MRTDSPQNGQKQDLAIDQDQARRHVELLTGSADTPINLRLFHDGKAHNAKGHDAAPPVKLPLAPLSDHWPKIEMLQSKGYGVFLVVNDGGNSDAEIKATRAVFIDIDGGREPTNWHVEPDFIVWRDAEHFHAYWRVVPNFPVDRFTEVQKRLAANYESDSAVSNLSRVMRLAGTLHLKDPDRPKLITLEDRSERSKRAGLDLSLEEVTANLPEVMVPAQRIKATAATDELDMPHAVAKAKAWLNELVKQNRIAVEGDNGDNLTYVTACEVRDLGVSEEKALDLMDDIWNPHCVPPWDRDELRIKIENAFRYAQNEPGSRTAPPPEKLLKYVVARLPDDTLPTEERAFGHFLTLADLLKRTPAPVEELVPGLVEKNTATFLAGPGGSHKSRLAIQWGLCLATGTPVWGRPVQKATFVYLSYEDPVDEVTRRVHAIANRLKLPADGAVQYFDLAGQNAPLVTVAESGKIEETPHGGWLRKHLNNVAGDKYVVLDGTYNAFSFEGKAKINEGAVMAAITWLHRLCAETGSTIIPLWHPSQAGQERGDASGWSVAWHNAPRARLSLTPVRDTDGAYELKTEKRNHGPKGPPLTLHFDNGILSPWGSATDQGENVLMRAVARVAIMAAEQHVPNNHRSHLKGWQLDEIERAVGRRPTQRQAKEALAACLPAGLLRYVTYSRHQASGYYPPDEGVALDLAREAKRAAVARGEG